MLLQGIHAKHQHRAAHITRCGGTGDAIERKKKGAQAFESWYIYLIAVCAMNDWAAMI
jgi:hypothetical protein